MTRLGSGEACHRRFWLWWRTMLVIAGLAVGLLMSACGGSGGSGTDSESPPGDSESVAESATATAVAAETQSPNQTADSAADAASTPGADATANADDDPGGSQQSDGSTSSDAETPGGSGTAPTSSANPAPNSAPSPSRSLTVSVPAGVSEGDTITIPVRLIGDAAPIAAFNFDIVYDQQFVSIEAPDPDLDSLNTDDRGFQCSLPPASGDVDPDPKVGRARLVCFSFGGPEAAAPYSPTTIATLTLTALKIGATELSFENVAFFYPDAASVEVAAPPVNVKIG